MCFQKMKNLGNVLGNSVFGNTVFFGDLGIAESFHFVFQEKSFAFFRHLVQQILDLFGILHYFFFIGFFFFCKIQADIFIEIGIRKFVLSVKISDLLLCGFENDSIRIFP